MKRALLSAAALALYAAHQDLWFWKTPEPLFLGFLPVGLTYHGAYTLAASGFMWLMVRFAWPSQLEEEVDRRLSNPSRTEPR